MWSNLIIQEYEDGIKPFKSGVVEFDLRLT